METISQRLQETTDRLGEIADGLRTNIAVHEERLKNQDKLIEDVRASIVKHQEDDQKAHQAMNDKLDSIKSSIDQLTGANAAANAAKADNSPLSSLGSKISVAFTQWKYAVWGALFAAGVLTHKAHFFEWLLKFLVGSDN